MAPLLTVAPFVPEKDLTFCPPAPQSSQKQTCTNYYYNMSQITMTQCSTTIANKDQTSLTLSMLRLPESMLAPSAPSKQTRSPQEQRDFVIGILDEVLDILNDDDDLLSQCQSKQSIPLERKYHDRYKEYYTIEGRAYKCTYIRNHVTIHVALIN